MTSQGVPWQQGLIQVYTGDGKGKTTAALGLALRAAGAGLRVFFAQFVKGLQYAELTALGCLSEQITLKQFGRPSFIVGKPETADFEAARHGLEQCRLILQSGDYPLVVLDEANIAVHFGLFSIDELIDAVRLRHALVEVVITGRYAHPRLIEIADLVTEMRAIKHYFNEGVAAREGIEK